MASWHRMQKESTTPRQAAGVHVFIAPLAVPKVLDAAKGRTFQPWSLVPPLSSTDCATFPVGRQPQIRGGQLPA